MPSSTHPWRAWRIAWAISMSRAPPSAKLSLVKCFGPVAGIGFGPAPWVVRSVDAGWHRRDSDPWQVHKVVCCCGCVNAWMLILPPVVGWVPDREALYALVNEFGIPTIAGRGAAIRQ